VRHLRRFGIALGFVVSGALVVRLAYVLVHLRNDPLGGDSLYYSVSR
jgi:hypothetical protein